MVISAREAGPTLGPSIDELTDAYRSGDTTPTAVVERVLQRIAERGDDGAWITVLDETEMLLRAKDLERTGAHALPLFGIPFGVKDSLDVAGLPTTLACPGYAYVPDRTAPAVQRLLDAGAMLVGKTNLDQFATGLTGTRTPYTQPHSVYGPQLISGGSSSGSALAVATGEVPFAVATDTAGSGRVPPALNGIVGFKPSRGLISTVGLVPACRSLDCVSLMAGAASDIERVFDVVAAVDPADPHGRPRRRQPVSVAGLTVGLPDVGELEFFGDTALRTAHLDARDDIERRWQRVVTPPFGPFQAAGELLYAGPWVAERLAEFGGFLDAHPDALLPVIRTILEGGRRFTATDVFAAEHRLGELRTVVAALWERMDVLVLPALGTTFSPEEVRADPIGTNTALGHYTHFGNLLDLCGAVVPSGVTADGRPSALMILGPALGDDRVLAMASALAGRTGAVPAPASATVSVPGSRTVLVVVGHHLSGQPRAADLIGNGGVLLGADTTAPAYRLLVTGSGAEVPALVASAAGGGSIAVERWSVPSESLPAILSRAAPAVALGRVTLADGATLLGFVADPAVVLDRDSRDITSYGGWRAYLAARDEI